MDAMVEWGGEEGGKEGQIEREGSAAVEWVDFKKK
jgi:hypothetical protein